MANQTNIPTPLEVMARIDQALADSGLSDTQVERQPLPLFYTLLQEWLVCQGVPDGLTEQQQSAKPWSAERLSGLIPELLRSMSACEIRESLRAIVEETRQLCRAHGSLSVWNQRELDNTLRTLMRQIDQAEEQHSRLYHP
jgi:hypothetical protein